MQRGQNAAQTAKWQVESSRVVGDDERAEGWREGGGGLGLVLRVVREVVDSH